MVKVLSWTYVYGDMDPQEKNNLFVEGLGGIEEDNQYQLN